MAVLEQLKTMQLAEEVIERDQPQQEIVGPRTKLARLHDPCDRSFHVTNKRRRATTDIRNDRRDCVFSRAKVFEPRCRITVVTIRKNYLVQLCVVKYWHFISFRYARNSVVVVVCIPRPVISFMKFCA